MKKEKFNELVKLSENEGLDFKVQYHDDNEILLHDILCLANSRIDGDRYIIYGVSDDKTLTGVNDKPKHSQADLVDMIRNAKPNRGLFNSVHLEEYAQDGKSFYILTIQNRPDKPFWLKSDFKFKDKCIRAGVVYTRHRDSNTPVTGCASDDEIEQMWRERFCINLPPIERFMTYLESEKWLKASDDSYYCKHFPEFRFKEIHTEVISHRPEMEHIVPPKDRWLPPFWTFDRQNIFKILYRLYYFDMSIEENDIVIWWGDDGRDPLPLPEIIPLQNNEFRWELSKKSLKYKVAKVIAEIHSFNLESKLRETKIDVLD